MRSVKPMVFAPAMVALTTYAPRTPLAVAFTLAALLVMVAGLVSKLALAPLAGGVKITLPPFTGSTALLAVTLTRKGCAKAVLISVL